MTDSGDAPWGISTVFLPNAGSWDIIFLRQEKKTYGGTHSSNKQNEAERIFRVGRIREEQLTSFFVENQARFYRLAYSYLKNREEALDAVQSAVCRALEKQDSLQEPDALRAWFYRILINVCTDVLRRQKRITLMPPEELDEGSYEDPLPADDLLQRRVEELPLELQTVIKLRFYEELSLREISEATGWNLNTVKTRLYTALKKLRVSLEGEEIYG